MTWSRWGAWRWTGGCSWGPKGDGQPWEASFLWATLGFGGHMSPMAINICGPKPLASNHLVWRQFWKPFICCNETDSSEICLPSFPNLMAMVLQGDEGERAAGKGAGRQHARSKHSCHTSGLMPGLCLSWNGKKADSALEQTGAKAFATSLERWSQVMGKTLHLQSPPSYRRGGRGDLF